MLCVQEGEMHRSGADYALSTRGAVDDDRFMRLSPHLIECGSDGYMATDEIQIEGVLRTLHTREITDVL